MSCVAACCSLVALFQHCNKAIIIIIIIFIHLEVDKSIQIKEKRSSAVARSSGSTLYVMWNSNLTYQASVHKSLAPRLHKQLCLKKSRKCRVYDSCEWRQTDRSTNTARQRNTIWMRLTFGLHPASDTAVVDDLVWRRSPGAEVGPVCNQMSPHFDSWSW